MDIIVSLVHAIREGTKAPGEWFDAYVNWAGSEVTTTAVVALVCALLCAAFQETDEPFWPGVLRRLITFGVVYLIGFDLWIGQFGIDGVTGSGWAAHRNWSLGFVDIFSVVAALPPASGWHWLGTRARLMLAFGLTVLLTVGVWIWPETITLILNIAVTLPCLVFCAVLEVISGSRGPVGMIGFLLSDPSPYEASKPDRGPQTPTRHRSI